MGKKSRQQRRAAQRAAAAHNRTIDHIVAESRRTLDEIIDAASDEHVDPGEVAAAIMAFFQDDPIRPSLPELVVAKSSLQRARAVADALMELDAGGVTGLTFAAAVAENDADAADFLEKAAELAGGIEVDLELANAYVRLGRVADALEILDDACAGDPIHTDAQCARAEALTFAAERLDAPDFTCTCGSGKKFDACCAPREQSSLDHFRDPRLLYETRDALLAYCESGRFDAWQHLAMHDWFGDEPQPSDPAELEGQIRFAVERGWLVLPSDGDDGSSILEAFADDKKNPSHFRYHAANWSAFARYGLWQIEDPVAHPHVTLTDLVTGAHVHAAVPPEYLEGMARWTVLLCSVIPTGGVWRTGGSMMRLAPRTGEDLAAEVLGLAHADAQRMRDPELLAAFDAWGDDPLDIAEPLARFVSSIVAVRLPQLDETLRERAATPPELRNTDGDPIVLMNVRIRVGSTDGLANHPDVEFHDDEIVWYGRELTPAERATSDAEAQAWAQREGTTVQESSGRWIRGRFDLREGKLAGEINSEARLQAFLSLLDDAGCEPGLVSRTRFDPAQDLAWPPGERAADGTGMPAEVVAAWQQAWLDEQIPALGGLTPRAAAASDKHRPALEALLREFEFRADNARLLGKAAPDVTAMRRELGLNPAGDG